MKTVLFSVHLKTFADSTLRSMSKDKLIEYVRMCEKNMVNAYETLDQQAVNFKKLLEQVERPKGRWKTYEIDVNECSECGYMSIFKYNFCPVCGADMRGEE